MIIGILDTETTGLDTEKDFVIEIGGLKVDTESWEEIETFSTLVRDTDTPPLEEIITEITGIDEALLLKSGVPLNVSYHDFCMVFADVDCFVAHNKDFDKDMLVNNFRRKGLDESILTNKEWVCSAADLYHVNKKCWTLSHLALDYGVAVDPRSLHRAVDDCRLVKDMLKERGHKFEDDFEYYKKPNQMFVALCKPPWEDNGVQKNQAVKLGFKFDPKNKRWVGTFKEGHEFPNVDFEIVEVER